MRHLIILFWAMMAMAGTVRPAENPPADTRPAEKTLLALDFEDILPGDTSPRLRPVWGNTRNTLIAVTNERASAGKHSLCFYVNKSTMHGYELWLPDTAGRRAILSADFFLEGTGGIHLEMRRPPKQLLWSFSFNTANSVIRSNIPRGSRRGSDQKFPHKFWMTDSGNSENYVWNNVKIEIPPVTESDAPLKITLTNRARNTAVTREVHWKPQKATQFALVFNISPDKEYRLFFDNIRFSVVDSPVVSDSGK